MVDGVDSTHIGDGVLTARGLLLPVDNRCHERLELMVVGGSAFTP
jgi:hypothetical protein